MRKSYLIVLLIFAVLAPAFAATAIVPKTGAEVITYEKVGLQAFSNTGSTLPTMIRIDYTNISGVCCVDPVPCTFISFTNKEDQAEKRYEAFIIDEKGGETPVLNVFYNGSYIVEYNVARDCCLLLRSQDRKEVVIRMAD